MHTLTSSIQHSPGSPGSPWQSNWTRKRKGIQSGKEEVKLSLFADDKINIWKTKDSKPVKTDKQIQNCMIQNQHTKASFNSIHNELSQKEISSRTAYILVRKNNTLLRNKPSREMNVWYTENHKTLMKVNGKIFYVHWLEEHRNFPYYPMWSKIPCEL